MAYCAYALSVLVDRLSVRVVAYIIVVAVTIETGCGDGGGGEFFGAGCWF
jgi:hypothetical protein